MQLAVSEEQLYSLIKKAVKEVIREERLEFFLKNLPSVSEEEMNDIEGLYGEPSKQKEAAFSEDIEI